MERRQNLIKLIKHLSGGNFLSNFTLIDVSFNFPPIVFAIIVDLSFSHANAIVVETSERKMSPR